MVEIKGLVSVTIPFYNAERFLRETVESVLAQTYAAWELLLVDDGSTDGSTEIAQSYAASCRGKIFYLEHPGHRNLGVNAARNLGARNSRGQFLAFLDSDDIWLPTKLEVNVAAMIEHGDAGFIFGSTEYWYEWDADGNNHRKNEVPVLAPGEALYRPPALLARSFPLGDYGAPCPCSFLLRRWAFERIGGFDEGFNPSTYQMYEDVAFLAKVYLHIPIFVSGACLDKNRCNRFSMTRQPQTVKSEEAARRFYFRWLAGYLRQNSVRDEAVWHAVRRESWFYALPLPVAALLRRVQGKLRREFNKAFSSKAVLRIANASPQTSNRAEARAPGRYSVHVVTSDTALDDIKDDWDRLSASCENQNPFMTFGWFRAWLRRLTADEGREQLQPYVLVIKQDENVVGIAPLVRRVVSRLGVSVRKLEFLTSHSDYNEFVVGHDVSVLTEEAMSHLAGATREWDFVDLRELREGEGRIEELEAATLRSGLPYRLLLESAGCFYMPISASWDDTQKKKHLRFARRSWAALEERAAEGFSTRVVERPDEEIELLDRIIAVEAQKHVGGRPSEPFVGRYPEVFKEIFENLGPRALISVVVVEKGDRLIAWRMLFRYGKKLWDYSTAYEHSFAELSPGTLLVCAAIDYGYEHGCDEFDFLRGMDEYKRRWTAEFRRNRRMILWNRRWKSRLGAFAYFKLHLGVRR
jgi:glycosyltransferase involved in cell wall biosynthesis/CelD/BcsL family acetyltransferase involved in cellulose biosynthesis